MAFLESLLNDLWVLFPIFDRLCYCLQVLIDQLRNAIILGLKDRI